MKANKQDKIIAIITSSILLVAVMVLIVSGLKDSNGNLKTESDEMQDVALSNDAMQILTSDVVSLSNVDSILVGSTFLTLNNENESEPETELETEPETEPETQPSKYENTFLVNASEYLNVRVSPSTDAEIVGKVYAGGGGEVIEKGDQWSKIVSGSAQGYINNDYAWFGEAVEEHIAEVCTRYAVSNADTLRVRKGPGTDYDIMAVINTGVEVEVISIEDDWTKVNYIGKEAYIASEYLDYYYQIKDGITIEEEQEAIRLEQERIAAEQAAEEQRKADEAAAIQRAVTNSKFVETVQTSAYNVTEEDAYLLACLVCSEAGYESYEGKLAVANVVLNRLNGGAYGSTIYDVVYAKGQFSVVPMGALSRVISNGPNAESIQAAKDALSGINNVPRYTNFCALRSANYDSYAEYSIICNQVFYRRK